MTAQASDVVVYKGCQFHLVGIKGDGLFDPGSLGVHPEGVVSCCWNGYLCRYLVADNRLLLHELHLWLNEQESEMAKRGALAGFSGLVPQVYGGATWLSGSLVYRDIDRPLPFTGGLLLGRDFIEELYIHMGFHPAWKYREVHELLFSQGRLTESRDRSEEMAQFRNEVRPESLHPPRGASRQEIHDWIERTFSRSYDLQ